MALLARAATSVCWNLGGIDNRLVGRRTWALVYAYEAVQCHGQMGDSDGLDDGQDHGAQHMVSSAILAVGLGRADVEIGDVAGALAEGEAEAGKEGPAR